MQCVVYYGGNAKLIPQNHDTKSMFKSRKENGSFHQLRFVWLRYSFSFVSDEYVGL